MISLKNIITKIVSGGQTGADRAALDFALENNIPCGGWCPKNRIAEDGKLSARYPLIETPLIDYAQRTEWNARDSDGTLIFTIGTPTGGTAITIEFALKHHKPYFIVDFSEDDDAHHIHPWLLEKNIKVLNVAGPRASKCEKIYDLTKNFLQHLA